MTTSALTQWQVRDWLVARIAEVLRLLPECVSPYAVFSELGLSSLQAVELAAELEDWSGCDVPATFVYDCPTIEDATTYIVGLVGPHAHRAH